MPVEVTGPVYAKNAIRITFRSFNWEDLNTSADAITASIFKVQDAKLVALTEHQDMPPAEGTIFWEQSAGTYQFKWRTSSFTKGTYKIVFEGEIDNDGFYQPVTVELKTLKGEVEGG